MWPEAPDDGTDNSDGEYPAIHQVSGIARRADDTNGEIQPEKKTPCRAPNRAGPSKPVMPPPPRHKLIRETGAEQDGTHDDEITRAPGHLVGELHRHQWHHQYDRCRDRNARRGSVRGSALLHRFLPG